MEASHVFSHEACGDFVYKSLFKGSYKELTSLLGVDRDEDLETLTKLQRHVSEKVHFFSAAGNQFSEDLQDCMSRARENLERDESSDQKQFRDIGRSMNFKGGSSRLGFGNGAFFAVIPEVADEIEEAFEAGELRKGDLVFSPKYQDLMFALLRNASRRQNREDCVKEGEPHSLATFSRFMASCHRRYLKQLCFEKEPSLSQVTNSTGYAPFSTKGESWGKGVYKKVNPRSTHADEGNGDSSASSDTDNDEEDDKDDDIREDIKSQKDDQVRSDCHSKDREGDGEQQLQEQIAMEDKSCEDERAGSIASEAVGSLLTSSIEPIVDTEAYTEVTVFLDLVPEFDKVPLCKNSQTFAKQVEDHIYRLEDALKSHFDAERLAVLVADGADQALTRTIQQAKACFSADVLRAHLARVYQPPGKSDSLNMKGFARAVRESCELVAVRASCDAAKLIDARSRRMKKVSRAQKQEDGPFAMAAWLCQEVLSIIHLVLEDLMVSKIAIESWNAQESEYKMNKKASVALEKRMLGDETGSGKVSKERLSTIQEVVVKEQVRRDSKYDKDRKGGRMHVITGASCRGNNRQRDYVVPI